MSIVPSRDVWHRRDVARSRAAYGVLALGVVGLLSAASRPVRGRLVDLLQVVPFVVPRTAAITLVFVSFALLLTARGLRRGHSLAWLAATLLLLASIALHVTKGIDIEEATLATAGVLWLGLHRDAFPVRASRATATRTLVLGVGGAVVTVLVAIGLSVTIGQGHRRFSGPRPHSIAARIDADLFPLYIGGHFGTAVLVAFGLGLVGCTLWVLFSPRELAAMDDRAHRAERERARAVVQEYGGGTLDYFALRDDKRWFFTGRSVVAYGVRGGVCLVSPDPIGPESDRLAAWTAFMAYAEQFGWSVAVLGAAPHWLPVYEISGLHAVYLGDEALVDCTAFTLAGGEMKSLRQAYHRVQRAGYTVTFHDPATVDVDLARQLLDLSKVNRRGEVERGFSMTLSRLFDPADTGLLLSVAWDAANKAQAFIQWVPARDINGWSLDVMRRNTDVELPNGTMDFLVIETIGYVADRGAEALDLNFAVLRSAVSDEHGSVLARLGRSTANAASAGAQLQSLWRFNAKYRPSWVPRYVAIGGIEALPRQGLAIVHAEGITEIPVLGKLLGGSRRHGPGQGSADRRPLRSHLRRNGAARRSAQR